MLFKGLVYFVFTKAQIKEGLVDCNVYLLISVFLNGDGVIDRIEWTIGTDVAAVVTRGVDSEIEFAASFDPTFLGDVGFKIFER